MEIKSNYIPHNFRNKYLKNVGGSYSSTVLQPTVSGEAGTKVVVIDDLETSSKDKALSANMGKYLNEIMWYIVRFYFHIIVFHSIQHHTYYSSNRR